MEIHVDEEELREFLDEDRPLWPSEGMRCSVPGCQYDKWFFRFGRYINHWIGVHKKTITMYECSVCRKTFMKRCHTRRHAAIHVHSGQVVTRVKPNWHYVDPGAVLPPRKPPNPDVPHQRKLNLLDKDEVSPQCVEKYKTTTEHSPLCRQRHKQEEKEPEIFITMDEWYPD